MVSGAQSQAPSIVLLAWRPLWGGVWYSVQKQGRALEIGGGRRKASAVLFFKPSHSWGPQLYSEPL